MQIKDVVEIEKNLLIRFTEVACFCHSSENRDVFSMRIFPFFRVFFFVVVVAFQCIN